MHRARKRSRVYHLVMSSIRRSRIRDGGEWADVAVQRPRRASPRWRDRLADRADAALSASSEVAAMRCASGECGAMRTRTCGPHMRSAAHRIRCGPSAGLLVAARAVVRTITSDGPHSVRTYPIPCGIQALILGGDQRAPPTEHVGLRRARLRGGSEAPPVPPTWLLRGSEG